MKLIGNIICLLLLLGHAGAAAPPLAKAQEGPLVLAFYYAWFDQNTWNSGQSVDLPAEPYASADRATIERHVAQAQGAGIDALVQAWYGPQVEGNQTETNFQMLLEIAQARGFKAAIDFETVSPFFGDAGAVIHGLASLINTHAQHPAYLRYQGKPVIFFWRQQRFSVDEWLNIRNQVDPGRATIWIAEGVDLAYQAIFDGHHLYNIAWAGSPAAELAKWGDRVRAYEAKNQVDRLWVATAMPGYNDTRLPRSNPMAVSRRDGAYYRDTWQGALASQPDMIVITSFNEWPEGTHLEPSAAYGNLYLDLTRELVTAMRGTPPANPLPVVPVAQLSQAAAPQQEAQAQDPPPDGPYIQTGSITNVRSGPSISSELIGRLAAGETVAVIGRLENNEWWQIEFEPGPAGVGWVSAEVVDFVGDAETIPVVEAAAPPSATTPTLAADEPATAQPETGPATDEPATVQPETSPTPTVTPQATETASLVQIPAGGVNVRSGPSLDSELLGRLEENTTAVVVGQNEAGDWWQIEYEAGENGLAWVAAEVVDFVGDDSSVPVVDTSRLVPTPTPGPVGVVEVQDAVNVRAEPSVDGFVLGGLFPGEIADVFAMSEDGDWWQIEFAGAPDQPAWVAAEFVRFQGDEAQVPIFGLGTATPTPDPTQMPTAAPTSTPFVLEQPTFAPTATSIYEATSAALLASRGTPDPSLTELPSEQESTFSWNNIPWGLLSVLVIIGFFWYQFKGRHRH